MIGEFLQRVTTALEMHGIPAARAWQNTQKHLRLAA